MSEIAPVPRDRRGIRMTDHNCAKRLACLPLQGVSPCLCQQLGKKLMVARMQQGAGDGNQAGRLIFTVHEMLIGHGKSLCRKRWMLILQHGSDGVVCP